MALLIPFDKTTVSADRQRKVFNQQDIRDLAYSIEQKGLINAPMFAAREGAEGSTIYQLVAGERRFRAIKLLHEEKRPFYYNGEAVAEGYCPASLTHRTGRVERKEAELDENLIRVDLSWQERTAALAELHALRTQQDPLHTLKATTREVATIQSKSDEEFGALYKEVRIANVVAKHLDSEAVVNARSLDEAYKAVLARDEASARAELIKRASALTRKNPAQLRCEIRNADIIEAMPRLEDSFVDLILTDPPYGIGAHTANYRARTELHHTYKDTETVARDILHMILTEGWRITKPKANVMIFTDIKFFSWLVDFSSRQGWMPWRRPIIWRKSASEGLTPWGRHGFAYTYDIIFFAKKGDHGLRNRHPDILDFPRVKRGERVYAAEKPVDLLKKLIELATMPGELVFDPCAGSGSTLVAAKEMNRPSLGFEIDPAVANLALSRINGDENVDYSALDSIDPERASLDDGSDSEEAGALPTLD